MTKKNRIEISLTDFVDFVCKSGSLKQTKVKQVKHRDPYAPATDFYRALREGLTAIHQEGKDKKALKTISDAITDAKKVNNYAAALAGYRKFWGRKTFSWFAPPFRHWQNGELVVRINPELGLCCGNDRWVIKLYLKSEKLSKEKITQVLTLMEHELRNDLDAAIQVAVLDVKNAKLFVKKDKDTSLMPLLNGEARSFETIWKAV